MGHSPDNKHHSKRTYWENHLQAWRESGKTQQAYCRDANLKPNTFCYWKRKLARHETASTIADENVRQKSAFVAVDLNRSRATQDGLAITLPGGIRLTGIDAQNLPLVKLLVGSLA